MTLRVFKTGKALPPHPHLGKAFAKCLVEGLSIWHGQRQGQGLRPWGPSQCKTFLAPWSVLSKENHRNRGVGKQRCPALVLYKVKQNKTKQELGPSPSTANVYPVLGYLLHSNIIAQICVLQIGRDNLSENTDIGAVSSLRSQLFTGGDSEGFHCQ